MDIKEEVKKVIIKFLQDRKALDEKQKPLPGPVPSFKLSVFKDTLDGVTQEDPLYASSHVEGILTVLKNKFGELATHEIFQVCLMELIKEDKVTLWLTQVFSMNRNLIITEPIINE